jgi:hypothetical protein
MQPKRLQVTGGGKGGKEEKFAEEREKSSRCYCVNSEEL